MSLAINWVTKRITVPKADLTFVSGTLYSLDTVSFFDQLKVLESSFDGIIYPDIQSHNPEFSVVGTTFVSKVEIINGYSIEFENGLYSVILQGSNNNIWDIQSGILVQNQVQVIPTNSAGNLVTTVATGSGVSPQDVTDIANSVNNVLADDFANIAIDLTPITNSLDTISTNIGTIGSNTYDTYKSIYRKRVFDKSTNMIAIYSVDGSTIEMSFDTVPDLSVITPKDFVPK